MAADYYDLIGATASRVAIFGHEIQRPSYMSPKQWLDFWDDVKLSAMHLEAEMQDNARRERELVSAKAKIEHLQNLVKDQANTIRNYHAQLSQFKDLSGLP